MHSWAQVQSRQVAGNAESEQQLKQEVSELKEKLGQLEEENELLHEEKASLTAAREFFKEKAFAFHEQAKLGNSLSQDFPRIITTRCRILALLARHASAFAAVGHECGASRLLVLTSASRSARRRWRS